MLQTTHEPFASELRDKGSRLDLPWLNPNLMPMSRGLVLLFALLPMVLASAELERLNHVVAIVGETPITMGDIQSQTGPLERSIYQQYPNNPGLRRQKVLEIKQQALETLVERQLILMEFQQEKLIRLRMIFLKASPENRTAAEAMLKEIRAKVEAGTDFASLAKVYHQGSQRNQGGDWGWVDQNTLRSDLSEEAFKLEEGQASEIITTDEGCYFLFYNKITPPQPFFVSCVL